jgi:hypothetical protein
MTRLGDLTVGALVRGILDRPVRIVQLEWHGSDALTRAEIVRLAASGPIEGPGHQTLV